MRITKKDIYATYGIEYDSKAEKIFSPVFGWIKPLLKNGNDKLGKGIFTWSMLPTSMVFEVLIMEILYSIKGTCPCSCKGCYATTGRYVMDNVKESNARNTILARDYMEFVKHAIMAQIEADKIKFVRIHASGDFFSAEYLEMWKEIIKAFPNTIFWTYTKHQEFETAFDEFSNANIVSSIVLNYGFNFGHCDYILNTYKALKEMGKDVYICRCGIDKNQHCTNCKGCSTNKYVLFIEHSTEYKAENDPMFDELKRVIELQGTC